MLGLAFAVLNVSLSLIFGQTHDGRRGLSGQTFSI